MKQTARKLVGAGIATAAIAIGATTASIGISSAEPTPSPSASKPSASTNDRHVHHGRKLLQRVTHGEFTLAGKKHRVIEIQRGTVSSVSPTSIKITSKDNFAGSYVITSTTRIRERTKGEKPKQAAVSAIKTGDHVKAVATKNDKTTTATKIMFAG